MMNSLFFDTTENLKVGLLDSEFNFVEFNEYPLKKASAEIHGIIIELLQKNNLDIHNLRSFFYIAGPGSYTGMRVSEGIAQILKISSKEVYSFYHYEIPKILGLEGAYITEAFKNEFYYYNYSNNESELITKDEFAKIQNSGINIYSNISLESNSISTTSLLNEFTKKIFSYVYENKYSKELFYFRSIDQEFTKKKS